MARCGCGAGGCACVVEAGTGATVTGSGSSTNPYVVTVGAPDCAVVRPCISAGNGASYNSTTGVVSARPSGDANNLLEFGSDGGLLVTTDCGTVRGCLSSGDGIDYDPVTGVIAARPSTDANNNLIIGGDGGLYVPPGAATVTTGCGLTGNGAASTPLAVAVSAWPYACPVGTNGGVIACGPDGVLRGEPRSRSAMQSFFHDQDFANIVVPAARDQFVARIESTFTNPDPCRPAIAIAMQELEFELNLPAQAGAEYGFDGPDEMVYHINRGSANENGYHIQVSKTVNRGVVGPGATATLGFDALIGRGTNGATYSHLQGVLRILFITQ